MDEKKRHLILSVAGGEFRNLPIIYGLQSFKYCDAILSYCVNRGIVGESFYQMAQDYRFLPIRVGNYLLKKMASDNYRPLTWSDIN